MISKIPFFLNSQKYLKKKKEKTNYSFDMTMVTTLHWRTHKVRHQCFLEIAQFQSKILMTLKCPGFSNFEVFTKVATFASPGGLILMFDL